MQWYRITYIYDENNLLSLYINNELQNDASTIVPIVDFLDNVDAMEDLNFYIGK